MESVCMSQRAQAASDLPNPGVLDHRVLLLLVDYHSLWRLLCTKQTEGCINLRLIVSSTVRLSVSSSRTVD